MVKKYKNNIHIYYIMNIIYSGILYSLLPAFILVSLSYIKSCHGELVSLVKNNETPSSDTDELYVFAYIWEPESCHENPSWAQCSDPQSFWGTNFVIHGLWPQYSSGGYPSTCTDEPFNDAVIENIGIDTMNHYWPNVKSELSDPDYFSFWQHEWTKHGTCTTLTQDVYFNSTINLSKVFGTPSIITQNIGKSVQASLIRDSFGGNNMVALQCESGQYLSGVYTCWSISTIDGTPDKQIVCPNDVHNEDTCSNDELIIPGFT